ncbi:MAG: glutathione S-transferase family protein [Myxococcales bacterium]|nr:glutathione S-transferase family protein [Myxococcales bacterium]
MLQLYEHPVSGNSHKVRLLLSFLELPYESHNVDLMEEEQHTEQFLALNPRGEVPVLADGDVVLRDSMAILVYLARSYDTERRWLPAELALECAVLEWLAFAASWIQFGVFSARAAVAFGIMANGLPHDYPTSPREGQVRGKRSLEILDGHLRERDWLVGADATIADIACFPYVALAPMGEVSLDPYPAVRGWISRFEGLPRFVSMPGLEASGSQHS